MTFHNSIRYFSFKGLSRYLASLLLMSSVIALHQQASAAAKSGTAEKPNIVLIISDDHDYEHLGFMGNKTVRTPNLDELARAGTIFTTGHMTASRCRPSLAGLLSGQYPHQNGIYANIHGDYKKSKRSKRPESTVYLNPLNSLPNLLKDAGYRTYGAGKYWEAQYREMGFTDGFEKPQGVKEFARRVKEFARKGQSELFEFIEKNAKNDQPMFMWWAPLLPHTPHNPPQKYLDLFNPAEIPVPDYISDNRREEFIKKEQKSLAMEYWMDLEIGKMRNKMKEVGEDKNTLYVFVIDNGWSNGLISKGSVYEKGFRSPITFTLPGVIPAGEKRDDLVSSLDIYSTILSYAGVTPPKRAEGLDLRKNIDKKLPVKRDRLYGAVYPGAASGTYKNPEKDVYALYVRTDKWKYIVHTKDLLPTTSGKEKGRLDVRPYKIQHIATNHLANAHKGDEKLYDLSKDPYELNNLANDAKFKKVMSTFKSDVLQWWESTGGKPLS